MQTLQDDPNTLSRLELVSLYINGYYTLDADRRSRFEAAFKKRHLPLPRMPAVPPDRAHATRSKKPPSIDRSCFLSYILLIYSGTAIFYSWIFLAERLIKMDFNENPKHKLIQTGIALFYVLAEIVVINYFSALD